VVILVSSLCLRNRAVVVCSSSSCGLYVLTLEIADQILHCPLGYIHNPQSMLQTAYRPSFWVAKKL